MKICDTITILYLLMGVDILKEHLSLTELIDMMVRRWWILAIAAISLGVIAFIYAQVFIDPLYQSDGTLYVSAQRTQTSDISQGMQAASTRLVDTYKEILGRRTFLSQVSYDVGNKYSVENLSRMISMESLNETEVMEITVTGKIPEDVHQICNSVLSHASDELIRVINAGSVKILDNGQLPTNPVSPDVKKYTLIAFLFGLVVGAVIVLLLDLFDTRIKSRDDVISKYKEPLLGEIPELFIREAGVK